MANQKASLGTISTKTYLSGWKDNGCKAYSEDLGVFVFIEPFEQTHPYFRKIINGDHTPKNVSVPCMITGEFSKVKSQYKATPLMPPQQTRDSKFFLSGLIVPELVILQEMVRNKKITGYTIWSPRYLGKQQFFSNPSECIVKAKKSPDTRFHGSVIEIESDTHKRPKVKLYRNSEEHPEIFRREEQCIEEILNSKTNFWWDL